MRGYRRAEAAANGIPSSYEEASARGILARPLGLEVGLSFEVRDGLGVRTVRLKLTQREAISLAQGILRATEQA